MLVFGGFCFYCCDLLFTSLMCFLLIVIWVAYASFAYLNVYVFGVIALCFDLCFAIVDCLPCCFAGFIG